ncbi:hypothetical protein LIER_07475 [Lithospermum erythrorhizon]|uniref:Uncharacterized protein n=1 Tax=Lithospermum erythrorhizon TaxID=34254 RepID=A0AAV3P8D3_LITER
MMCSNLGHVTEVKSNINDKTISFLMLQDGKPVNTGRFMIKDLHGPGLVTVNVHEAIHRLRTIPRLKISVLINGKPKMILKPILLVMCVRIIFNCDSAGGTPTLIVKGLDTKKKDCILRIRKEGEESMEIEKMILALQGLFGRVRLKRKK